MIDSAPVSDDRPTFWKSALEWGSAMGLVASLIVWSAGRALPAEWRWTASAHLASEDDLA